MDLDELLWAGADGQARALAAGEVTAPDLAQAALARAARADQTLGAFRVLCTDAARTEAAAAQRRLDAGERTPLLGVPVAVKDDVDVAGHVTAWGLDATGVPAATTDGEVVRRLRAAGAVLVGKTQVPQLLAWPVTESPAHGATRNPWDPTRSAGGSSGGSGAATASGVVGAALGSDAAGSIRVPAAWCGLVGVKPTRDLVPTGSIPHSWHGLSQLGPLARDVASAARLLGVCADREYTVADAAPLRVGLSHRVPPGGDPRIGAVRRRAVQRVAAELAAAGHRVRPLEPQAPADTASLILSRYLRSIAETADGREHLLDAKTARVAALGRRVPDRMLQRSLRRRAAVTASAGRVFDEVDVLVQPGPSVPPPPIGALDRMRPLRALQRAVSITSFLGLWNLVGFPVVSIPVGSPPEGASVQLIGAPHTEEMLLRVAAQLEPVLGWAARRPPIR